MLSPLAMAAFYFLHFTVVGVLLPYLPPYLGSVGGLDAVQVGRLLAVGPLMTLFVPPLWGYLADRRSRRSGGPPFSGPLALLWRASALSLVGLALYRLLPSSLLVVSAVVLYLSFSAVVPLADTVALGAGLPYQRVRLVGSVGFAVAALGFGSLLGSRPELRQTPLVLEVAAALCVVTALVGALWLPRQPAVAAAAPAGPTTARPVLPRFSDVVGLLRSRPLRDFILCSFFHWLAQAPNHGFLAMSFRERGLAEGATGLAFAVAVAAEVAMMASFARFRERAGLGWLLVLSFAASAVRWWVTAQASSPLVLIGIQALHGLTFGAFYVAAVQRVKELTPDELSATGQALFAALVFGLGGVVGYLIAGWAFASGGATLAFSVAAALELVALAVVVVTSWLDRRRR